MDGPEGHGESLALHWRGAFDRRNLDHARGEALPAHKRAFESQLALTLVRNSRELDSY